LGHITTNSPAISTSRIEALQREIALLSSAADKGVDTFQFRTYFYDLRERDEVAIPEAALSNEKMSEAVLAERPDIIYAAGAAAAKLFASKTRSIPIVIGCKCNPGPTSRRWHLVTNLCAPERNITGFTRYDMRVLNESAETKPCGRSPSGEVQLDNLIPARAQALKDSREPPLTRIGYVGGTVYDESKWKLIERTKAFGIELVPILITSNQLDNLKAIYAQHKLEAAIVNADAFLDANTRRYIQVTSAIPIPTLFPWDEADSGAWMHFGTRVDLAKEAARYILEVARGTPIKNLPVSFPTEYELVVNHKLAKAHGWVFPKKFLLLPQREPNSN
jgi:ABC-type uncharacterized transport system substrate-binding protein